MFSHRRAGLPLTLSLALSAAPLRAQEAVIQKAPVSPRYAAWVAYHMPRGLPGPAGGGKEGGQRTRGYVPSPVDLSHVHGPIFTGGAGTPPFPPAYDLRALGQLTPVKDQGIYGTCWTFACMGALEGSLRKAGLGSRDLSEWHLAYYGYVPFNQSLLVAFTPGTPAYGTDPIFDQGGSDWQSAAILGRGTGAVDDSACPYQTGLYNPRPIPAGNLPNGKEPLAAPLCGVYYLFSQDDPINVPDVKYALTRFGPVVVAMDWEDDNFDQASSAYRDPATTAWSLNHEVCIVGWDDAYAPAHFPEGNRPVAPGAWIVRNSWGPTWAEQGYFHLSYDSVVYDGTAFVGGARTTRRIRQYDPLGWCGSRGFGGPTAYCANVFRTDQAETLTAAAFYAGAVNTAYELQIRTNVNGDPGTGVPVTANGSTPDWQGLLAAPGFHVVPLDPPVTVPAGSCYAVVLKLTTPGYDYPVPVQEPVPGYSESSRCASGRSYLSEDGKIWQDLASPGGGAVVCLKVFTE